MNSKTPQIGFDRFIQLEWVTAALKYRAGFIDMDEFNQILDAAGLGVAARKKSRTVLNRLWLEPRTELADFANRGLEIYKADPKVSITALTWGVAIATYPFFGKVAELVGRLSALQGDCASAEVHRRMSEVYGEREGTSRNCNMVLQSQANWGTIERIEKGKRLVRLPPITIDNNQLLVWLIEAGLRYLAKPISVSSLQSLAVLYPFVHDQSLTYLLSNSPILEIRSEGVGNQVVSLKSS